MFKRSITNESKGQQGSDKAKEIRLGICYGMPNSLGTPIASHPLGNWAHFISRPTIG